MTPRMLADSRSPNALNALGSVLVLLFLTYAVSVTEYWHFAYAYASHFGDLYDYQKDLLHGHADWVADQNRVLGPLLVAFFQRIFGVDYENAYQHVLFYSLVAFNISALVMFLLARLRAVEAGIGVLLSASVPLLLINYWWFPWTVLEATLLLVIFAIEVASLRLAVRAAIIGVVYAAWTITKETSALLPVWLAFRYGVPAFAERRWGALLKLLVLCAAMLVISGAVVAILRHWLWISASDPNSPSGLPTNIPEFYGTHLLILKAGVLDYYREGLVALATLRLPWQVGTIKHWPDWPAGLIDFVIALVVTLSGMAWAFARRAYDILALSLTSLVYLIVCFSLVNMPEADKLMPEISIGLAAYALICVRQRRAGMSGRSTAVGEPVTTRPKPDR